MEKETVKANETTEAKLVTIVKAFVRTLGVSDDTFIGEVKVVSVSPLEKNLVAISRNVVQKVQASERAEKIGNEPASSEKGNVQKADFLPAKTVNAVNAHVSND